MIAGLEGDKMDNEIISNEEISLDSLTDEKMIESYNEVEAFLKLVEEEIKKTDTGDQNE